MSIGCIYVNLFSQNLLDIIKDEYVLLQQQQQYDVAIKERTFCPSARHLFLDDDNDDTTITSIFKSVYLDAEKFHNGGGNLKSIETYLNDHMDETYKMLGITFTPEKQSNQNRGEDDKGGEEDSTNDDFDSIAKKVVELMKAKDIRKRGGYDQREYPGTFKTVNDRYFVTKGKNARGRLDVIEPFNTERWKNGLGPIFDICKSADIIGQGGKNGKGKGYEEKFMCSFKDLIVSSDNEDGDDDDIDDEKKMSTTTAAKNAQKKCEMISIGSNGQWGFEETIAETTNCTTHTFDCTVQNPRKPNIDSIHFYPYCVSAVNEKIEDREYMTYSKLIEQTNMTDPPSLFKMDVEGFEFDVIAQMLDEALEKDTMHLLPTQISVELHYATRMYDVPWMLRYLQASEIAMFMGMMYNRGGYVPVNAKLIGPGCYSCAELLFVRAFCD